MKINKLMMEMLEDAKSQADLANLRGGSSRRTLENGTEITLHVDPVRTNTKSNLMSLWYINGKRISKAKLIELLNNA